MFVYSLKYVTDYISFIIYLAIHENILIHLLYKGCPPSCIDNHSQMCLFCLGPLVYFYRTPLIYLAFQRFDIEINRLELFQKRIALTTFDFYDLYTKKTHFTLFILIAKIWFKDVLQPPLEGPKYIKKNMYKIQKKNKKTAEHLINKHNKWN